MKLPSTDRAKLSHSRKLPLLTKFKKKNRLNY